MDSFSFKSNTPRKKDSKNLKLKRVFSSQCFMPLRNYRRSKRSKSTLYDLNTDSFISYDEKVINFEKKRLWPDTYQHQLLLTPYLPQPHNFLTKDNETPIFESDLSVPEILDGSFTHDNQAPTILTSHNRSDQFISEIENGKHNLEILTKDNHFNGRSLYRKLTILFFFIILNLIILHDFIYYCSHNLNHDLQNRNFLCSKVISLNDTFRLDTFSYYPFSNLLKLKSSYANTHNFISQWDEFSQTADQKVESLWNQLESDSKSLKWPSLVEQLIRIFIFQTDDLSRIQLQQTFRPWKTTKVIHTQNAYAKFRWKATLNHPYTGIFSSKQVRGIMSFSKSPNQIIGNFSSSFGIGLRFYRDNAPPSGFVSMFPCPLMKISTYLGSQWNIFSGGVACNHVSALGGLFLSLGNRARPKYSIFDYPIFRYPNAVGLLNLGNQTTTGHVVSEPFIPFSVCLVGSSQLAQEFSEQSAWGHPLEMLEKVSQNKKLFDVYAIDHPWFLLNINDLNLNSIHIAEIYSDSEFISSGWGDRWLHTQHQDFEADLTARPDWKPFLPLMLLDGFAYLSLSSPSFPSAKQMYQTFSPSIELIFEMLSNDTFASEFLKDDLGFGNISNLIDQINKGAYHSSNPGKLNRRNPQNWLYNPFTNPVDIPALSHLSSIIQDDLTRCPFHAMVNFFSHS